MLYRKVAVALIRGPALQEWLERVVCRTSRDGVRSHERMCHMCLLNISSETSLVILKHQLLDHGDQASIHYTTSATTKHTTTKEVKERTTTSAERE